MRAGHKQEGGGENGEPPALGPAERAAARATVDGLRCMATMLQQHEAAVGVLLAEMEGEGEEDGSGGKETLRALAALAGGLHKVRDRVWVYVWTVPAPAPDVPCTRTHPHFSYHCHTHHRYSRGATRGSSASWPPTSRSRHD